MTGKMSASVLSTKLLPFTLLKKCSTSDWYDWPSTTRLRYEDAIPVSPASRFDTVYELRYSRLTVAVPVCVAVQSRNHMTVDDARPCVTAPAVVDGRPL